MVGLTVGRFCDVRINHLQVLKVPTNKSSVVTGKKWNYYSNKIRNLEIGDNNEIW